MSLVVRTIVGRAGAGKTCLMFELMEKLSAKQPGLTGDACFPFTRMTEQHRQARKARARLVGITKEMLSLDDRNDR